MRIMKKYISLFILVTLFNFSSIAQTSKVLDRNINHPSHNTIYPSVSGDGRVMVFMTDYSDDGEFAMMMSKYRAGKWQNPEDAGSIGSSKINNWGGYSLNYDGTQIYFSSRRSNGLGKFDLWYSEYANGEWSRPANVGKPVNSASNEGNPSISADGQRIYFMQCESMTNSDVSGCQIYYSDKGPRGWGAPVKLPEHLNVGNTTSPRILPDNSSLVFASDRPGGKGGVDLWLSKRTGDHWSEPQNIEIVNTAENDYFLAVTVRSIAFFTSENEKGNKAIAELRLPEEYRLNNVIIQQGTIKDEEGNNLVAEVRAYNLETETYEVRLRLNSSDRDFIMILPEGARYDVAYSEIRQDKMYHSEIIDAMELVAPRREYPNIILYDIKEGMNVEMTGVQFQPYSTDLEPMASLEFSRISKLLNQHKDIRIEVGVYQKSYIEDDSPSNEDLTELKVDTSYNYYPAIRTDVMENDEKDSLLLQINSKLGETLIDTTLSKNYMARMSAVDSVRIQELKPVYHNDRTQKQAEVVGKSLVEAGISEDRIEVVGYGTKQAPVDFAPNTNRMVVVRFLNGSIN